MGVLEARPSRRVGYIVALGGNRFGQRRSPVRQAVGDRPAFAGRQSCPGHRAEYLSGIGRAMPYLDRYRQPRGDLSGDRRTVCDKRESVERLALIKRLTGTDVVAD